MRFQLMSFICPFLAISLFACGSGAKGEPLFVIQTENNKSDFRQNGVVQLSIGNKKNKSIQKVTYSIAGKPLETSDQGYLLQVQHLGNKTITALIAYEDGNSIEISKKIKVLAATAPEIYSYEIIHQYPHDINAYTQGLEFYRDTLYESTGLRGKSSLRKVDFKTGTVLKKIDLENTLFGEGLTILNNKIYQLTWQSGMGFIYDANSMEKLDNFAYGESKEGWGLCNNGTSLFKSDGTEKIWMLDPETLAEESYIEIVTDKSIFNKANELEYVDGKIYANVYQKESMMIIDATSGAIEGVINFTGLKDKVKKHDNLDVLNGVAYHPDRKTFFVTGKNWDTLFEVRITKKEN